VKDVSSLIAVIPARGGSKRLPRKNALCLGGLPLVSHSIRFAASDPHVTAVVVSTDDREISRVAADERCEVVPRSTTTAGDHATITSVVAEVLEAVPHHHDDLVLVLQPTSPFRKHEWVTQSLEVLRTGSWDSVAAVSSTTAKVGAILDGEFRPEYTFETRGQDQQTPFRENGLLYLTRVDTLGRGSLFGDRVGALVVDHPFARIDIDTPDDLAVAEAFVAGGLYAQLHD
jgi:CMP-N-acetylneuraminic acid synthetase